MNRRELLQTGLSVLAAAGIDGEVATLSPVNPQAFVIRTPATMTQESAMNLRKTWNEIFAGTAIASVPMIILTQGMTLEVIDKP